MNASMPGFCEPVDQMMPDGDSAIRGVGSPLRGRNVMLRVTMAPILRVSTSPASSLPVPAHPAATMTGVGSTHPSRSTATVRFTPATSAPPEDPLAGWEAWSARRRAIGPTARARD